MYPHNIIHRCSARKLKVNFNHFYGFYWVEIHVEARWTHQSSRMFNEFVYIIPNQNWQRNSANKKCFFVAFFVVVSKFGSEKCGVVEQNELMGRLYELGWNIFGYCVCWWFIELAEICFSLLMCSTIIMMISWSCCFIDYLHSPEHNSFHHTNTSIGTVSVSV